MERDWHLGDAHGGEACFHHHLAGEFHAGGDEFHVLVGFSCDAPQAAVKITHWGFVKEASDETEDRISEPAVFPWHRPRHDGAAARRQPAAHDEVVARAQFFHEAFCLSEVVARIRITHENVATSSRFDTATQCAAVAFFRDGDHACPKFLSDALRTIGRAVVCDDDLAFNVRIGEAALGHSDASSERLRLIEAWHNDGEFHYG